ncbi:MAG: hypothetical protein WCW66_04010 [Patescibacteria group bacterium]
MNIKRIIIGVVFIPISIWILLVMEDPAVKYFGGFVLLLIGLIMLITGARKDSHIAPAPPTPMEPDEHTPGYKPERADNNVHKPDVNEQI